MGAFFFARALEDSERFRSPCIVKPRLTLLLGRISSTRTGIHFARKCFSCSLHVQKIVGQRPVDLGRFGVIVELCKRPLPLAGGLVQWKGVEAMLECFHILMRAVQICLGEGRGHGGVVGELCALRKVAKEIADRLTLFLKRKWRQVLDQRGIARGNRVKILELHLGLVERLSDVLIHSSNRGLGPVSLAALSRLMSHGKGH